MVIDDGSGIEDEDLPHIFSPGYSTKIDYETGQIYRGLGLTLIKDIVEIYLNGKIKVKSKFGKGTIFIIYIPAKELEEDES
ncbi:histidine kinase/DNA gyrase B/HSP90-like ATPase [Keratinibaculum paraultunense]|uniref:histidine kinase n=1 Tax=Keratinibaculum paraultunense TaxID=1278232 RepID=A0A4R3KTH7_9FIRM|nr:ATP-binding protein [Keratinibaculum paraultunense]QQY79570.1 ATP-binding protein [Keratinibaculum paraultunense]TCS87595.1 histidine kinase/DNA gyrase B/HSP90-like ATPase [Keratinibaculum paraultunense]